MLKCFVPYADRLDEYLHSFFYMFNGNFYKYISYLNPLLCKDIPIFCSLKDKNIITDKDINFNYKDIIYTYESYDIKNKKFKLKKKNGTEIIERDLEDVIDSSKNVYSQELLNELENHSELQNEEKFVSENLFKDKDLSNIFGKNNIIFDNKGPYQLNDSISCKNIVKIKDPKGDVIEVNLFKLIDQNFGNVLSEKIETTATIKSFRKGDIFGRSVENAIKSINYNDFEIDKDCNMTFNYDSSGWLFGKAKKIPEPFGNILDVIKNGINMKLKNFFKILFTLHHKIYFTPKTKLDLIELFKISKDIEENRNAKIITLLDETRKWLEISPRQSGGTIQEDLYELSNEWKTIEQDIKKTNNEIDNLNDEEFINLLNDTQNFKNKVNVEIMLSILETNIS
jgi:hypothetical protein